MNRNLIVEAFPSQPRMQAAVEALFADAEDATSRLNTALLAIGALGEGAEGIVAQLAAKQPRNDTLDAISILGPDPGVLEQVQAGIFSVRPIDAADVKSLITRELADTRYLGGAHAAASATKLATARSITASGDAAWTVSFDGSANVSAALTLATVNSNTGTYGGAATVPQISVDGKGRITGVTAVAISGPSGAALTKTDDTNVTLTLGGTPATALLQAASLTLGWTGQLGVTRGGTGLAAATLGDVLYGSATNTLARLTGNITATKKWLNQTGTGTVSAIPAWTVITAADVTSGAALTKTDDTNVTLTLGGTPASALLAAASLALGWTGTLAVTRGGTGDSGTAWTTYTPTLTPGSGAFTSATTEGRYKQIGKTTFFWARVAITTNGTAAGQVNIGVPVASAAVGAGKYQFAVGMETDVTGDLLRGAIGSGEQFARVKKYDNTYPGADGRVLVIQGSYEAA